MKQQQLSRRERQIMDIVYEHHELTAKGILEHLEDPPGYATVRSLLRILEEKGHLKHRQDGRVYVYTSTSKPEKIRDSSLKHLLKTFFGGSITEAVATFINDPETTLSKEDIQELESIIKKAKKK